MIVRTNYILIDYENVQPTDLAMLSDGPFKVRVFLGANQTKIPVTLAAALQPLGPNAEYMALETKGSNALDFHIAYYIGVLSTQDTSAFFHVISKDTGFDPLIKHLKDRGIFAHRSTSIATIPYFKPAVPPTLDDQLDAAVVHLGKLQAGKPRTRKALLSALDVLFKKEFSQTHLSTLFEKMCSKGIVKVEGTKLLYDLQTAS